MDWIKMIQLYLYFEFAHCTYFWKELCTETVTTEREREKCQFLAFNFQLPVYQAGYYFCRFSLIKQAKICPACKSANAYEPKSSPVIVSVSVILSMFRTGFHYQEILS